MSCIRWPLALLGLALGAADLPAQAYLGTYGAGYVSGRGGALTYARSGRRGGLALSVGGFAARAYAYGVSPVLLGGFVPLPPPAVVTVIYTAPPPPPEVVFVSPTRILVNGLPLDILPRNRQEMPPAAEAPERLPPPPLPGENAGAFRPLDPGNRERARRPLAPEQPPPAPKKPEPPKPPEKPKEPPRPPRPDNEAKPENVRLLDLGRRAFAALEYGRAAQRFRQATQVAPDEPTAYFLLAQALFALGKYDDAVEAIHNGMARDPDWPRSRFRPLELYGPNVADYAEQLQRLSDVLKRHPNDPVLLFLSAHQLWFDGRKEEARPLFQRARAGLAHPADADRFLRALPAPAVL
jgi:hypothetical protein